MRPMSILEALGEGVISVPETLWDGVKRTGEGLAFWDTKEEVKIGGQNERAYEVLKEIFKYGIADYHSPIEQTIRIILYHFYESLPHAEKKRIVNAAARKGLFLTSKVITSAALSVVVAKFIVKKLGKDVVLKKLLGIIVRAEFNLLAMQGLLYKAGAASDRLRAKFPRIWSELRRRNLDMVYFLVEKPMHRYLEAIRLNRMCLPAKLER